MEKDKDSHKIKTSWKNSRYESKQAKVYIYSVNNGSEKSYTWDINTTEHIANYILTREKAIYTTKVINNNWPDNTDV